jgi:arylsulfatase A-like enzyme
VSAGRRGIVAATAVAALLGTAGARPLRAAAPRYPDVLVVTVDTLRADRLGAWGYRRPTSPAIDALLAAGARLERARTVEPLTNPAMVSLWTSLPPHVHGATRNGLPVRPGLPSLPKLLARRGFRTGAVIGNWTLKDRLSGLARDWQSYEVLVSRKRWFGLFKDEANGGDLTERALDWLERQRAAEPTRPLLLWVHYVEPHAPYRLHERFAERLGIDPRRASASDRYDTEIAAVDAEVGRLLSGWDRISSERPRLTVLLADHGEAFGERGEQGHGRVLHAPTLDVPLGFVQPGRIRATTVSAAVSTLDVGPTVLGLLGLPPHPGFRGRDLTPLLEGGAIAGSPLCLQAHRGAVQSVQAADRARRAGLLEVGRLSGERLEVLALGRRERRLLDLGEDRAGRSLRVDPASPPSPELTACLDEIRAGLAAADRAPAPELDAESIEELRALGYLD